MLLELLGSDAAENLIDDVLESPVVKNILLPCITEGECFGTSNKKLSLSFNLGWTFYPNGVPKGTYQLIPAMATAQNIPANGEIEIIQSETSGILEKTSNARLVVAITNGPTYDFNVTFDLPAIHEPAGLKRRLTNLGLYAGTDQYYEGRALWAIRAFKRIYMNSYTRNNTVNEDDHVDGANPLTLNQAFLSSVQNQHGAHPSDNTNNLTVPEQLIKRQATTAIADANLFLNQTLARTSYVTANTNDDRDPTPANPQAIWAGVRNPSVTVSMPGYELSLGLYDNDNPGTKINNRVNLPQPVHMLQLALFETGYWVVAGDRSDSRTITCFGPRATVGATNSANGLFGSLDGHFGRSTHWAVREFQCHAKMNQAAVEDVTVTAPPPATAQPLYLQRLTGLAPVTTTGDARYPLTGRVSGSVNPATARAIQDWLDRRYRCPVLIYAAPSSQYLNPTRITAENIWRHNDIASTAPRMFALDLSSYYSIPPSYKQTVQLGGHSVPNPITIGDYTTSIHGNGARSIRSHVWVGSVDSAEVSPQTTLGKGGLSGTDLTSAQISTFRVIRTVSHFECNGFLDSINAYDNSGISLGPCHWTLARTSGTRPKEAREMGALISYAKLNHEDGFNKALGYFGMQALNPWPIELNDIGTYTSSVTMQTEIRHVNGNEVDEVILCGITPDLEDNKYVKTWHFFYRMQMACRTVDGWQRAMWDFSRFRIEDILDRTFQIGTRSIRIGDYVTSEKTVAMLLRWHIISPSHVYGNNVGNSYVKNALNSIPASLTGQDREDAARTAILQSYSNNAPAWAQAHANQINGWTNVPQIGLLNYQLNLTNPELKTTAGSFELDNLDWTLVDI